MMMFRPNDRVKIIPGTEHYRQAPGLIGTVISPPTSGSIWYRVKFDNGYQNSYRVSDLTLVRGASEPEPEPIKIQSAPNFNSEIIEIFKRMK